MKIVKKLILLVNLILIILTSSCGVLYNSKIIKYLKNDAELNSQLIVCSLVEPVWNFNNELINKILDIEIKNKNIYAIFVLDTNNILFAEKYNNNYHGLKLNNIYNELILTEIEKQSTFKLTKDIIYNENKIGYTIIYFTDKELKKIFY